MKAAIYMGPGDVRLEELPDPEVGESDVLIENLRAGICGSDVSLYKIGPNPRMSPPPTEFGHEMISRVRAKGANATEFEIGQRVYPYPLFARGNPRQAGALGGFSELILAPNAKLGHGLYAVSDAISDRAAAFIEPFTIAMHAAQLGRPSSGKTAILFGAGTIGLGAALGLRFLGVERIMVADLSDLRLAKARDLGFLTCNPSKQDLRQVGMDAFGEARSISGMTADIDIWIEATGAAPVLGTFQDVGKLTATLVEVGLQKKPILFDFERLAYSQHTIVGSGGYQPSDVTLVMAMLEARPEDAESLITHEFPLTEMATAMAVASDPEASLAVQIVHDAAH
ncbi:MAG: alcohol dehydrogenase catalytic domain-containing protein [Bifidobacteriaceae bacterium]|jgi:2-desacetyl-2-hydroxyethyl bacteriochlorophyllide A dehydrogenase|nr:alcohol dehydrogenase catalytic domain-containing protein [Bifidobacteriaceae bacterium]